MRSGMIEYVADDTHEAHVALMLWISLALPLALLEFAKPIKRRQ